MKLLIGPMLARLPHDFAAAALEHAGRRRAPLDFGGDGRRDPEEPPHAVDVIVPVHGAADDFRRCLASVRAHTDLGTHRLVVVLDGDGQTEAERALEEASREPATAIVVLRHATARGFVASVNRGIAESRRDVVLLNSDTIVTAGWLEKLGRAAYSSSTVATATPFSNEASICSIPRPGETNAIPTGHDVDSFAALVERVSRREYPRLPTGVGVCLYVKRRVLDELGPFDEQAFGRGYGEEVDFCFRALKAGRVHVLDDATFIHHAGARSFGTSRARRVRAAELRLQWRHPEYRATIARFLRDDPVRPARERVLRELAPARGASGGAVLHVVHGWPPFASAGTEIYARWLALRQAERRDVTVYARIADPTRRLGQATELLDRGVRVRLVVNNFTQRSPLSRNALRSPTLEADFGGVLDDVRPEIVHVHHLAGHCAGLLREVERRQIPYVYQAHDWWAPCARSNLLPPSRVLCPGPAPGRCAACLPMTRLPPAALWNRILHRRRSVETRRILARAAAVITDSRFTESSYRALGLLGDGPPVYALPLGLPAGAKAAAPPAAPPLRFGVIGSMMPHKGIHVAVEAFRAIDAARATLDVRGDPTVDPAYAAELRALASPAVRFHPPFDEADKDAVLGGLHVLVVPSLGLEGYGIAVREAIARGVPVLASRRGALVEAFGDDGPGAFFEPGDASALAAWVERLCAEPRILAEWRGRAGAVASFEEHAEEIERVYRDVLGGRR